MPQNLDTKNIVRTFGNNKEKRSLAAESLSSTILELNKQLGAKKIKK